MNKIISTGGVDAVLPAGAHFGTLITVKKMTTFTIAESSYGAGLVTPRHEHETASFIFVVQGGYVEQYKRERIECRPGNILFRPPVEAHHNQIGERGAHCLMLEMPESWCAQMQKNRAAMPRPRQMRDGYAFLARIRREINLADDLSEMCLQALAMELSCEIQRTEGRRRRVPEWLKSVRERVKSEFVSPPSLDDLAEQAGVHPAHLARSFRQHYGCTIGECVRQERMEYCRQQLRQNQQSLYDIAASAGFASQAHFSTAFTSTNGMTPTEFRRLNKLQMH